MDGPAVTVVKLNKRYGPVVAVDAVSFSVTKGEIFGLLGPNGAGKTTTLEMLEGIRQPDSGTMAVFGIDPVRQARRLHEVMGVQLQIAGLPPAMTPAEAMKFFCAYHKVRPRMDLLGRVGLGEKLSARYHQLSTGQQRRLALALAICFTPKLLILDEPTAGLDVQSRLTLHELMNELKTGGTTIILATHDMAEAEKMADRVTIIANGKVIAEGTPRELTARGGKRTKISVCTEQSVLIHQNEPIQACTPQTVAGDYAVYFTTDVSSSVTAILGKIEKSGDRIIDLRVERPSLEERFLELTGGGARQ
jgi:ABC-2 type transport system ATP-binding protein